MCFAIAPEKQEPEGRLTRYWKRVAHSPLRLLSLGAIIHGVVIIFLITSAGLEPVARKGPVIEFMALFGLVGSVLFGALLTWLPNWFNRSPVEYAWYALSNFLMLVGLVLLAAGLHATSAWAVGGAASYLLAWLLLLRALWWTAVWVRGTAGRVVNLLIGNLALGGLGIVVFIAGLALDHARLMLVPVELFPWLVGLPVLTGLAVLYRARYRPCVSRVSKL